MRENKPYWHHEPASGIVEEGLATGQLNVLVSVARGLPQQAIANELHITKDGVERLITPAYAKLGVVDRLGAVVQAFRRGIIDPNKALQEGFPYELFGTLTPVRKRILDVFIKEGTHSRRYRAISNEVGIAPKGIEKSMHVFTQSVRRQSPKNAKINVASIVTHYYAYQMAQGAD
jgi:DNA-binding CsgD family transcriptional regulator